MCTLHGLTNKSKENVYIHIFDGGKGCSKTLQVINFQGITFYRRKKTKKGKRRKMNKTITHEN